MTEYRTGNHWGVTIVREGTQPPDAAGKRPDAELAAVVMGGAVVTTNLGWAQRVCVLLARDDDNPWHATIHGRLVTVVGGEVTGDPELAQRICDLLNADGAASDD